MNLNYINRVRATSEISLVDIMIKKNNFDDKYEFYMVHEIHPKSELNNYNELIGRNITAVIESMPDRGYDDRMFQQKLEDIPVENVKFGFDDWEIISVKG